MIIQAYNGVHTCCVCRGGRGVMGLLTRLWKSQTLSSRLKAKLIQTLVWPIVTYGAEAWTTNKEQRENIEAFEMWCYRRALRISYVCRPRLERRGPKTRRPISEITGTCHDSEDKIYFGHISRHHPWRKISCWTSHMGFADKASREGSIWMT